MRDAKMLSQQYNGILDDGEHQNHQYRGRLIFEAPGASGKTDVYYYLISVDDKRNMLPNMEPEQQRLNNPL
jgi:hypothetical protein